MRIATASISFAVSFRILLYYSYIGTYTTGKVVVYYGRVQLSRYALSRVLSITIIIVMSQIKFVCFYAV